MSKHRAKVAWSATAIPALVMVLLLATVPIARADFSVAQWQYLKPITLPSQIPEDGLVEVPVDAQVFSHAARGLADLRIVERNGAAQEMPYFLSVKQSSSRRISVPAKIQDIGFLPGQYSSLVADLGREGILHNEIVVHTTSSNFQREVVVEGSNDAGSWSVLAEGIRIFDFTVKERDFTAKNTRVGYPESTVRYLRARIKNNGEEPLNIDGAGVFQREEAQAEEVAYRPSITGRTDDPEGRSSVITIDLGSPGLPTERLTVHTGQVNFHRRASLEGSQDGEVWSTLRSSAELYAYDTPKFTGDSLHLSYPESYARYLRLTVHNEDNPPLAIEELMVVGLARKLVFQPQPGTSYDLYYGNAVAPLPSYDLERLLPYLETESLPVGSLGGESVNPRFTAPQPPVTERFPWLIPVGVALAVAVVGLLLFGVLRRAKTLLPPAE